MSKKLRRYVLLFALMLGLCFTTMALAEDNKDNTNTSDKRLGTIYYISSSEGSDENDGLSEETPWKTFAKLPELELSAGDKVLLKSGDSWLEQFVLHAPTGTQENPVIISSYGEGDKPKLALFENEVPKYSGIPVIEIINAEGVEITGLDIGYSGVGIDFHYNFENDKNYLKVSECHFHDIYGFYQLDKGSITRYPHAVCIIVTGRAPVPGVDKPLVSGLYIDKCTTYDASSLFTYSGEASGLSWNVHDMYVTNCVMENNGYYGIALCGAKGGYMDNCKIVDCGSRYAPMGSMAIMITNKDFTVMNCDIGFQQRLETNPDGGGVDFEWDTHDVDFINNYIHDNSGAGVMFYTSGQGAEYQNSRIRFMYNVFENNNQNVYNPGGAELLSVPLFALVDGQIYNNKYMESKNMFTMYMDASVDIKGNESYPEEMQGKVWPLLDFDVVRDYVINGTEIATDGVIAIDEIPTWTEYAGYAVGFVGGIAVIVMGVFAYTIVITCKRRKKNETI